jgi:putative peptidoglycan lipid II flippase
MVSNTNVGVAKAAGILMLSTVFSRVVGYIRDIIIGAQFGQGSLTDAYLAAFSIPDFLYYLLVGGAVSSAFIPVFSSYIATERKDEGWRVASTVVNIVVPVMLVGISIAALLAPYIVKYLLVPGFSEENMRLTVTMTRIMLIQAFFMALNGICMGILNSHQRFLAPAVGSVMYNVAIIVFGVVLSPYIGIIGFSIGVAAGAMIQFAIQFFALRRIGLKYQFVLDWHHPGVRRIIYLMLPVLLGFSMNQLGLFVQQNISSSLADGALTAVRWAQRIMQLPIGLFAITIAMAVFPTLTGQVARREMNLFKESFSLGLRTIFFITIPCAVGLALLGKPVIRLLYQQGNFSAENTAITAYTLAFFCLGLFAYGGIQLMNRVFYALQNTWTPVTIGASAMALNIVLNFILIGPLGTGGLALAYSLAGIANLIVLLVLLRKNIGPMGGRAMGVSFLKTLAISLTMGLSAYGVSWVLENYLLDVGSKGGQLLQVAASVAVGIAVFFILAVRLNMEEMNMVMSVLGRRFRRNKSGK